jgi:hypothetical protein
VGPQVKLTSSDNQVFEVDEEIANESQTVKNMIEGKLQQGRLQQQHGSRHHPTPYVLCAFSEQECSTLIVLVT